MSEIKVNCKKKSLKTEKMTLEIFLIIKMFDDLLKIYNNY